ncbi:ComF family protein [Kitasatospora purpeofusca]|uniref:ComF family protein n=1 Tax=Kitasatospora purpeofusca TaxID=67352 RepID=UPI002A5A6782|nr:ComF family protein [Kitasatospora purpeofusca]MDY0816108.1 ComF family protein [Kitasatospora purpeofusca]
MPRTTAPPHRQSDRGPFTHALTGLLDALLPAPCAGCGADLGHLCPECRHLLATTPPTPAAALPGAHAAAPYDGPVRRLLLAHKERGALGLAGPLGDALARAVRSALGPFPGPAPLLLVPVPSARAAVRARGHDPTLRLARAAAGALRREGLEARALPLLRHARPVADQAGLSAAERHRNLRGALTVRPPGRFRRSDRSGPAGFRPVLVDDLVTTGASLVEAARALSAAGLPPAVAATVAAAVPRHRQHRPDTPDGR